MDPPCILFELTKATRSEILTTVCVTVMIIYVFISFSTVQMYIIKSLHSLPSTGILRTHNVSSSQLAGSSVGKTQSLHWYNYL